MQAERPAAHHRGLGATSLLALTAQLSLLAPSATALRVITEHWPRRKRPLARPPLVAGLAENVRDLRQSDRVAELDGYALLGARLLDPSHGPFAQIVRPARALRRLTTATSATHRSLLRKWPAPSRPSPATNAPDTRHPGKTSSTNDARPEGAPRTPRKPGSVVSIAAAATLQPKVGDSDPSYATTEASGASNPAWDSVPE